MLPEFKRLGCVISLYTRTQLNGSLATLPFFTASGINGRRLQDVVSISQI